MGVFDKVTSVSKDVVDKVKSSNDISKIKTQIAYEDDKITDYYIELGKNYYNDKPINASEQYIKICEEIATRLDRIERLNQQINLLKGVKICKSCGAVINDSFLFCGLCGAKLPEINLETTTKESDPTLKAFGDKSIAFSK